MARLLMPKPGQPVQSGGGSEEGAGLLWGGLKAVGKCMQLTLGLRASSMSLLLAKGVLKVLRALHHTKYSFVN